MSDTSDTARAMRDEIILFLEGKTLSPDFFERYEGVAEGPLLAFLNSIVMPLEMGQLALAKLSEEAPSSFWETFLDAVWFTGQGHIFMSVSYRDTIEKVVKKYPELFGHIISLVPLGPSGTRNWLNNLNPNKPS